jgi:uncharacterized protein (DUF58 family)
VSKINTFNTRLGVGLRRANDVLSHDFCPWANRWVYWLKNPLSCLALAAGAALLCGCFVNRYVFVLAGALCGVMALGTVWPLLTLRGVRCVVEFERARCRAGEPVNVTIRVTNRWPWPVWGLSLRRGFADAEADWSGVALARIGGWSSVAFVWEFRPERRGVYPLETPRMETGFPFGLFRAAGPVAAASELIVWPQTVSLLSLPDTACEQPRDSRLSDRRVGEFGDMLGTRGFRAGDSLRRVHWAQTARHGRLVVCERQAPAMTAVYVNVDVAAGHQAVDSGGSALEAVIGVAASICESLCAQHACVECAVGGEVYRCGSHSAELRRLLDALARIPRAGLPPSRLFATPRSASAPPGALQIVVTTALGMALASTKHDGADRKWVVVDASRDGDTTRPHAAWVRLDDPMAWSREFPRLWRRACHAA